MEELSAIVGDAAIIEDAAQSQGVRRNGKLAGSLGQVAATSFYPGKNIGAYGDAGGVLTDDDDLLSVCATRETGVRRRSTTIPS